MAKSKRNRCQQAPPVSPTHNCKKQYCLCNNCKNKKNEKEWCANNIDLSEEAVNRHWDAMPDGTKQFIYSSPDGMFSLSKLIKYWDASANRECTIAGIAGSTCGAMWYLALIHLRRNDFKTARALTINGAFLHQCYNSSMQVIKDTKIRDGRYLCEHQLPYFFRGCTSINSPETIKTYIERYLPKEYTQMMTSFANLSDKKHVNQYINQIGEDWKSGSSSCNSRRTRSGSDGAQITIMLVDDVDENICQSFDIGSSTTLKSLFNDYADERGISLRQLRFSYGGSMLFLSSAGHKTPEEMHMTDGDVIKVHDMSAKSEKDESSSDDESASAKARTSPKKKKTKKNGKGKTFKAANKKKQPQQHQQSGPTKLLAEYKVDHSVQLTKIHDEAADQFKSIRQRLNNLAIARSSPKVKKSCSKKSKSRSIQPAVIMNPSNKGLGGKAGKSHYVIQVGEVQNLYKSTKPSYQHQSSSSASSSEQMPTLDLHGYTTEEALLKLDEYLSIWVNTAMEGCYPFVQPAVIICGCGNQVLSEVVQDWIKCNDKVSNASKATARRLVGARAA